MTQWFYAKGGERLGPVEQADLQARLASGELNGDTLVWREGLPQWLPVRDLAAELAFGTTIDDAHTLGGSALPEADATFAAPPASPYAAPQATSFEPVFAMRDSEVVYAGFLKRFAAAMIDSLLMMIVYFIISFISIFAFGASSALSPNDFASMAGVGASGAMMLLPIIAQVIYYTWMTASSTQATLGKMAVGIKVVRSDGERIGLGRSFGRWLAYFVLSVTCIGLIVSAFMSGLTARKQGLHDMVVDTLVVDKWAFTAHPERQRRELGALVWTVIVLGVLAILAYVGVMMVAIFAAAAGAH